MPEDGALDMKTDVQQRQAARKFVEYWTFQRGSEKGEDQQFWNSLLRDVLGVTDVERHIQYQVPVHVSPSTKHQAPSTKFLDAWIPETRVLIEHKSRGVNLDAPQSAHGGLTPYEQAVEYDNARSFDEKARWIVTCNFDEFRIYDRAKPLAPPMRVRLGDLPKEAHRLAFLVNPKEKAIDREFEISVQAGRIVGEIYDALLKQYDGGSLLSLRGDSETRSLGDDSQKSPNLQNSKTPSSESNEALRTLCSLRQKIEQTAQAILDARANYPDCSFAELYDENLMPTDLRAAHEANDRAVLAAYGLAADTPEPEIVAHLFKLYAERFYAYK